MYSFNRTNKKQKESKLIVHIQIKLKQIIRCVKQLRNNINKIFDNLNKNHTQIDKKMEEIQIILSYDLYSDL